MGLENMRRWPMYIVFAICILLVLSLLNSWSLEAELRNKVSELSTQLQECSKQQSSCMEESLSLLEQKDGYMTKLSDLERTKEKLQNDLSEYINKAARSEGKVNQSLVDVELCKTELQSLKNLQLSQSASLDTLRLKKDSLKSQLADKKQRIEELEREIEKLKSALTAKSVPNLPASPIVTPAPQPPKLSPALNPINEPAANDAKEEIEDTLGADNAMNEDNDGNVFDQQLR